MAHAVSEKRFMSSRKLTVINHLLSFRIGELCQPRFLMVSGPRDKNLTDDERLALYAH